MREIDVIGVRVEMPSQQPIVLLREVSGERYLPIWIGAVEATAIAFAQQGVVPPRPLTHDLMKDLLEATGNELAEVRITDVQDNVFFATLVLASGVEVRPGPRTRSRWRCARARASCAPRRCWTRPAWLSRRSRRTRSRSSASSSTTSLQRTSSRTPEPSPST